jgi:hypothetical protein
MVLFPKGSSGGLYLVSDAGALGATDYPETRDVVMDYSAANLNVCAHWYNRPVRGEEFLRQVRVFLEKVIPVLPGIPALKVVRDPRAEHWRD